MKSNKKVYSRFIIFLIVVGILGCSIWFWWKSSIAAVNSADQKPILFQISQGEGVKSIASRLYQHDLIRSPTAFYIMVKLDHLERQLQAGDFRLNKAMNTSQIAKGLTHGILDIWITTLEGWRSEEIATKVNKHLDIPETELLKYTREGYMFPDTYQIQRDATAPAIVQMFIKNFYTKVTPDMITAAEKNGLSLDQVVILASIVEREGKNDEDRPIIAGILLNRLKEKMPLQVDATLQYILGYQSKEKTWWKQELSEEDKKIESPYNTYIYTALPPKPISNPGIASIKAVIYPTKTSYMYYLHDKKGTAHYAKTFEEHTSNIRKYLGS